MSTREWRPDEARWGIYHTGNEVVGATVDDIAGLYGWNVRAWSKDRSMAEAPVPLLEEAQALASEWLDRREAEAQPVQKGGTT